VLLFHVQIPNGVGNLISLSILVEDIDQFGEYSVRVNQHRELKAEIQHRNNRG